MNLTGMTARMHIKRDPYDTTPIFVLDTSTGGITLAPTGQVTLNLAATSTYPVLSPPIDQDGETWYHDLLLVDPTQTPGRVDRVYQGTVSVLPGVTV